MENRKETNHPKVTGERIQLLRNKMEKESVDVALMTSSDSHGSEYVADYYKVTEYFSGCTSDNVILLITQGGAFLWTDGRYFLSASMELEGTGITLMKSGTPGVPSVEAFLEENLKEGQTLGYDGTIIRAQKGSEYRRIAAEKNARLRGDFDPAQGIWEDRPKRPANRIFFLSEEYCGESFEQKLLRVREKLAGNSSACVISKLDDIMWLFNMRGSDIAYNPVALSYCIITEKNVKLFLQNKAVKATENFAKSAEEKLKNVEILDYDSFFEELNNLEAEGMVYVDPSYCSDRMIEVLSKTGTRLYPGICPVTLLKAVKNRTELENLRECYRRDSVVLTRFLYWVQKNAGTGEMTEITLAEKLDYMRSTIPDYLSLSFETISAYGENAAIVHYEPKEESCAKISPKGFYLVDSGGQYQSGTTDVTRTIALGELTEEMRRDFTYVAMANLRLMNAKFKFGCTGANLDMYARSILWEKGIDFNHGTGHGIGFCLNVHEGPQNISWRMRPQAPAAIFEPGMITSDEPGIYRDGEYGIRTETIVECVEDEENEFGRFLRLKPLTFVPIDLNALDYSLMDASDIEKLNAYHKEVYEKISPDLQDPEELAWLKNATKTVSFDN